MAALWNRAGHYIWNFISPSLVAEHNSNKVLNYIFWPVVSFFFYLFLFLAQSQRSQIGCLSYFHTWCGLNANLECRSEMYCTRLAKNTRRKNRQKIRHLCIIAQFCRAISSQLRHVSTIGKKLLNSSISPICPYNMVNFGPLAAEIVSLVWGTPANVNS